MAACSLSWPPAAHLTAARSTTTFLRAAAGAGRRKPPQPAEATAAQQGLRARSSAPGSVVTGRGVLRAQGMPPPGLGRREGVAGGGWQEASQEGASCQPPPGSCGVTGGAGRVDGVGVGGGDLSWRRRFIMFLRLWTLSM